jgi:hypothetical protein
MSQPGGVFFFGHFSHAKPKLSLIMFYMKRVQQFFNGSAEEHGPSCSSSAGSALAWWNKVHTGVIIFIRNS